MPAETAMLAEPQECYVRAQRHAGVARCCALREPMACISHAVERAGITPGNAWRQQVSQV
jgi:hypothetical protein